MTAPGYRRRLGTGAAGAVAARGIARRGRHARRRSGPAPEAERTSGNELPPVQGSHGRQRKARHFSRPALHQPSLRREFHDARERDFAGRESAPVRPYARRPLGEPGSRRRGCERKPEPGGRVHALAPRKRWDGGLATHTSPAGGGGMTKASPLVAGAQVTVRRGALPLRYRRRSGRCQYDIASEYVWTSGGRPAFSRTGRKAIPAGRKRPVDFHFAFPAGRNLH